MKQVRLIKKTPIHGVPYETGALVFTGDNFAQELIDQKKAEDVNKTTPEVNKEHNEETKTSPKKSSKKEF